MFISVSSENENLDKWMKTFDFASLIYIKLHSATSPFPMTEKKGGHFV